MYQSQDIMRTEFCQKNSEQSVDNQRLVNELSSKRIEIILLTKSLQSMQQRYIAQEALLSSTN